MKNALIKYEAILFDLDGTLIDSAPDLVYTLNELLADYGRAPTIVEEMRQYVSYGSTRLLAVGFAEDYPIPFAELRQAYLQSYQRKNTQHTDFFSGIPELLTTIEAEQVPWAVVTNKPTAPTQPIAEHLELNKRAAAIVCGDTLAVAKPDPAPLLLACQTLGVEAQNCVYIGDAKTDVEAGKRAGMATIGCAYGYVNADAPLKTWGADAFAATPDDILALISN